MRNICLCFQVHHPFHFQTFKQSDIGSNKSYYDDQRIEGEINDAVINSYLPTNEFLLELIKKHKGKLKVAFYISGTTIDQFLMYEPQVLNSFRQLADTGQVEFLGGTASHSLITLTNYKKELAHQVKDHQARIEYLLGVTPQVFVNADLIYSDLIGKDIGEAGYRAMITNGCKKTLVWRSPNYVYSNSYRPKMDVYFRNEEVSDEFANKLNNFDSDQKDANGFLSQITSLRKEEPLLNVFLDYKDLGGGEIEKKQQFMETVVGQINKSSIMSFVFPSEIADRLGSVAPIHASDPICWVSDFHSSYFPGNELQIEAIKQLYMLQNQVAIMDDLNLQKDWQYLQTSDHFHLMDEQHPDYQNNHTGNGIYKTKYDAFISYMNILDDFRLKIHQETERAEKQQTRRQVLNKNKK